MDPVADRLDAGPALGRAPEEAPGHVREAVDLAVPAGEQVDQDVGGQVLDRDLLRTRGDGVGLPVVLDDQVIPEDQPTGRRQQLRGTVAEAVGVPLDGDLRLDRQPAGRRIDGSRSGRSPSMSSIGRAPGPRTPSRTRSGSAWAIISCLYDAKPPETRRPTRERAAHMLPRDARPDGVPAEEKGRDEPDARDPRRSRRTIPPLNPLSRDRSSISRWGVPEDGFDRLSSSSHPPCRVQDLDDGGRPLRDRIEARTGRARSSPTRQPLLAGVGSGYDRRPMLGGRM